MKSCLTSLDTFRMAWEQDRGSPQPDDRAADPTWRFEPESVSL